MTQSPPIDAREIRESVTSDSAAWPWIPCPLCGGTDHELVFESESRIFGTRATVALRRCRTADCGLQLTNPQPRGEALAKFYESAEYYTHDQGVSRLRQLAQRLQLRGPFARLRLFLENHSNRARWTKRFVPDHFPLTKGATLLDFGCGNGVFLALARQLGMRAVGLEIDPSARKQAEAAGLPVAATLDEVTALLARESSAASPPLFQRVILRHVFEHLEHPIETLRDLAARMTPDGLMMIAVPNAASAQAKHFGQYWLGYDMPRHLWHFTPTTLSRLVQKAGLHPLRVETVEIPSFADISARLATDANDARPPYEPGDLNLLERRQEGADLILIARRAQ